MRTLQVFLAACCFAFVSSAQAEKMCATDDPLSFIPQEVTEVLPSLVHISAMVYRDGGWESESAKGFVFSRKRYILTVAHVLEDEQHNLPQDYRIAVYFSDCTMQMAEVVYVRRGNAVTHHDLLVLRVPNPPPPISESSLTLAQMRHSTVYLIDGFPHGNIQRKRGGIIDSLFFNEVKEINSENLQKTGVFPYIHASTFARYGNSGSVLLDAEMRGIGLVVVRGLVSGQTYALHLRQIRKKLEDIGLL